MKVKLIVFALMAILALNIVPTIVMAAPTLITKTVKFYNSDTERAYGKAGTITLDLTANTVDMTSEGKLAPNTEYAVYAIKKGHDWQWFFTESTDNNGNLYINDFTLDPGEINWWISNGHGASFIIVPP